jgi:hypothetical protein
MPILWFLPMIVLSAMMGLQQPRQISVRTKD